MLVLVLSCVEAKRRCGNLRLGNGRVKSRIRGFLIKSRLTIYNGFNYFIYGPTAPFAITAIKASKATITLSFLVLLRILFEDLIP